MLKNSDIYIESLENDLYSTITNKISINSLAFANDDSNFQCSEEDLVFFLRFEDNFAKEFPDQAYNNYISDYAQCVLVPNLGIAKKQTARFWLDCEQEDLEHFLSFAPDNSSYQKFVLKQYRSWMTPSFWNTDGRSIEDRRTRLDCFSSFCKSWVVMNKYFHLSDPSNSFCTSSLTMKDFSLSKNLLSIIQTILSHLLYNNSSVQNILANDPSSFKSFLDMIDEEQTRICVPLKDIVASIQASDDELSEAFMIMKNLFGFDSDCMDSNLLCYDFIVEESFCRIDISECSLRDIQIFLQDNDIALLDLKDIGNVTKANKKSMRSLDLTKHFKIFTDEKTRDFIKQGKILGINDIKDLDLSLSIDKKFEKFVLFCDFLISCYYRRKSGKKVVLSKSFIAKHIGVSSRTIARYKSISQIFGVQYIETHKKKANTPDTAPKGTEKYTKLQGADEIIVPFIGAIEILVDTYKKEENVRIENSTEKGRFFSGDTPNIINNINSINVNTEKEFQIGNLKIKKEVVEVHSFSQRYKWNIVNFLVQLDEELSISENLRFSKEQIIKFYNHFSYNFLQKAEKKQSYNVHIFSRIVGMFKQLKKRYINIIKTTGIAPKWKFLQISFKDKLRQNVREFASKIQNDVKSFIQNNSSTTPSPFSFEFLVSVIEKISFSKAAAFVHNEIQLIEKAAKTMVFFDMRKMSGI